MHCFPTPISNSKKLFMVVLLLNFELSLCQHHVCLSQEIENGSLVLRCSVDRLAFEVSFLFDSKSFGFCLSPTPKSDKIVKCDDNITQNTETNVTVLTIRDTNLYKSSGIWTCKHGSYKHSIYVKIPKDLDLSLLQEIRPCHEKLCLTWYQQQNELILVCEVPQLYLEVIFHYGENKDYAYCTSPLPTPHCFSPHKNSEITQDIKRKRTILRLSSNQLNTLNGKWACSHGSDSDSVTVKMVNTSLCLKGTIRNEKLHFECRAHNLLSDINIYAPDGSLYGGCPLPTKYHKGTVICDSAKNISFDLDKNIMYVLIKLDHTFDKFGEWKCKQKTTLYEDTFQIQPISDTDCNLQIVVTFMVTFLSSVTLGICTAAYRYSWYRKLKVKLRKYQKGRQPGYTATELEPLTAEEEEVYRFSLCKTCGNLTAFSYCYDCKEIYCEACFELHSNTEHTIIQIEHIPISAHAAKCMMCKKKNSHRICLICQELFCDSCICTHEHQSKMIKPLVIKPHDIMRQRCSECRISVGSEKVVWKKNISIPRDNLPTRICGIAFLGKDHIALADFSNKKVKVFSGDKFKFHIEMSKEPRCMVGMYDTAIAITFPYERAIEIYTIDTFNKKKSVEIIDLHDIGKPYNIAFNQERFAVEIGAEMDGFVAILNKNGEILNRITTAVNYAFFTGHTIRLALDTQNKRVIISAMSKKAVTCLNFDGNEKWTITVPSPRGAYFATGIPNKNSKTIFVASKRGNTIYQINSSNGTSNVLLTSKDIMNPRNIAYNPAYHLFCIQVQGDDEDDELAIYKYHEL